MRISLRQTFVLVLFLGLFAMALRPVADPDFWWHLRTGELIVQTRSIPRVDPFSFTRQGAPWITQEWLSELLFYGLFRLGGLPLLFTVFALIVVGAFFFTYKRSPLQSQPYVAGFVLLLGAIATAPVWGVRPQIISLLLTSVFLYILDSFQRTQKIQWLIPLPFISALWVNMHAGYLLGFGCIGIYLLGQILEVLKNRFASPVRSSQVLRPLWSLTGALVLCLASCLLNPNGIRILIYPFQTLTSPSMQELIQEWASPDFHQLIWQPLALFFLALIATGMLSRRSLSPTSILLTVVFAYAALNSMRNVPLFIIATIPALAEQIGCLLHLPERSNTPNTHLTWSILVLLSFVLVLCGLRWFQVRNEQPTVEAQSFPSEAVDWIIENHPQGNLYNTYSWGGYLIWRLYPQYLVYIDGRADVYGDQFIYDYLAIYDARPGWQQAFNTQKIRLVLIEPNSGLAATMLHTSGWTVAYADKTSILFVKNDPGEP
jgi:hypothetical protein